MYCMAICSLLLLLTHSYSSLLTPLLPILLPAHLLLSFQSSHLPTPLLPHPQLLHLGVGLANALANLHNARRANSPVLNIVGDMSTWHRGADSALETDIEAIAKTVSAHVHTSVLPGAIRGDTIEALKATDRSQKTPPGGKGRVSTLIVPHDRSWEGFGTGADERGEGTISFADSSDDEADESETGKATSEKTLRETTQTTNAFLALCAEALVETQKGKVALYVGGEALLAADGALQGTALRVSQIQTFFQAPFVTSTPVSFNGSTSHY